MDWIALTAGSLLAAALNLGGHYAFRPPRPALRPPWTYVYGVGTCLIGLALNAGLTGQWVTLAASAAVFGAAGATVMGLYALDGHLERSNQVDDLHVEIAELRRRLADAGRSGT